MRLFGKTESPLTFLPQPGKTMAIRSEEDLSSMAKKAGLKLEPTGNGWSFSVVRSQDIPLIQTEE